MLINRAFCRSWQGRIAYVNPSTLLHHGKQSPSYSAHTLHKQLQLLRSFRSSAKLQKPPRANVQTTPFENFVYEGPIPPRNIVKAIVFTGAFSLGCFMSATILEYENTRQLMIERAKQSKFSNWLKRQTSREHGPWSDFKTRLKRIWNELLPGEKVFAPLCALNILVFALWRVPSMRQTMFTYFCSNPAARVVCWPMFLSTFSHYSLFHLFANMYVLHSFSSAAVISLGREQFLAVYLSGGVFASLASFLYKAAISQAGLSIGASGSIMAILAYVCSEYPDTQLSILFLPAVTFSAGSAIKVIMGMDLVGCIMGWKFFDHAAHLGGALFGMFWAFYGVEMWKQRIPFLTMYHDWRKTK